jgi:hypothetical protein
VLWVADAEREEEEEEEKGGRDLTSTHWLMSASTDE